MSRTRGQAAAQAFAVWVLALIAGCAPQPAQEAPATVEAPQPPKRIAPQKVAQLLNAPADTVTAAFGNPVLRKTESGGEVWLYAHANGCSLDVVLFPMSNQLIVAHATTQTPPRMSEADCLSAIANIVR